MELLCAPDRLHSMWWLRSSPPRVCRNALPRTGYINQMLADISYLLSTKIFDKRLAEALSGLSSLPIARSQMEDNSISWKSELESPSRKFWRRKIFFRKKIELNVFWEIGIFLSLAVRAIRLEATFYRFNGRGENLYLIWGRWACWPYCKHPRLYHNLLLWGRWDHPQTK